MIDSVKKVRNIANSLSNMLILLRGDSLIDSPLSNVLSNSRLKDLDLDQKAADLRDSKNESHLLRRDHKSKLSTKKMSPNSFEQVKIVDFN
jgi:hypothetical protein